MSEQGPPLLTALREERDGRELQDTPPGDACEIPERPLAEDVDSLLERINHDDVLRRAFKVTGDLHGAEDVRQSLYRNLISLPEEQRAAIRSVEKYISASIRNLGVQWRKQHRRPQHESLDDDFVERIVDDFANQLADEQEIEFMLKHVPDDCRQAYVLYFGEDCTAQEVAQRLGINTEAMKKRLRKAMLLLADARRAYRETE